MRAESPIIGHLITHDIGRQGDFPANTTIYEKDTKGGSLFFVKSGIVFTQRTNTSHITRNSRFSVDTVARKGQIFGFDAYPDKVRRSSAIAATQSEVLEVTPTDMREFIGKFPALVVPMMQHIEQVIIDQEGYLERLTQAQPEDKVGLLFDAIEEFTDENGILQVSQQVIGNRANMAREYVQKNLKKYGLSAKKGSRAPQRLQNV